METTLSKGTTIQTADVEGQIVRRKFVNKAKIAACAMLAIGWMSHISSGGTSSQIRANKREFIQDSMHYDLLTNGTAIGAYASSADDIARRWTNVSNEEARKWREEDNGKAVNFLLLLGSSAMAIFFFCVPKGKEIIERYITHGVK